MPFVNRNNGVSEEMKRLGSGGWKGEGDVEMDPELAELVASDESVYDPAERQLSREGSGGMHEPGTRVTPGCEGYFELCVKSVEAVAWDPEAEEELDLDPRSKRRKREAGLQV